jgi:Ser/Thr protein kinase RdoA (MazF antagonist)
MEETELFLRLSPDRVLQAAEAGGWHPTGHCTVLNALENRVFDLRLDDDSHVVLKFYRPGRWSRQTILDEHRLLAALQQAEIPVCSPLRFEDGETLHEVEGIFYALWPRTGGRSPDELADDEVRVLGRLLARIHNTAEGVDIRHRRRLGSKNVPIESLELLEDRGFLPPSCAARYRRAVMDVVAIYDEWSEGVAHHVIHGDCHLGNLLWGDDGWFFLDFDDMVIGPAVQDIWMLLPGRDAYAARQREILVEAYREFRDIDERSLQLVEPLRAFRFIFYTGWIARRWEDPAFPDAFPHFGSERYWEDETRDLEQQLDIIVSGAEGLLAASETQARAAAKQQEPELSNKDFFWDMD